MCLCTPGIKTPFCGKPGCEWPKPSRAPDGHELVTSICAEIAQLHYEGKIGAIAVAIVLADGDVRTLMAFQKGSKFPMCAAVHLLDVDVVTKIREQP